MRKIKSLVVFIGILLLCGIVNISYASEGIVCGHGLAPCANSPIEGFRLQNSQTTAAADTAVVVTLAAITGVRHHVYSVEARCSAGTSGLTITDGGTTRWSTAAAEVGVVNFVRNWSPGLTGSTNSAVVITLATCGVGNTGILIVQSDRY